MFLYSVGTALSNLCTYRRMTEGPISVKNVSNIDNAFSVSNQIIVMGDCNINYLNKSEKDYLESNITPYGLQVFCHDNVTR